MAHLQNQIQALQDNQEQDPEVLWELHQKINSAYTAKELTIIQFLQLDDQLTDLYPIE